MRTRQASGFSPCLTFGQDHNLPRQRRGLKRKLCLSIPPSDPYGLVPYPSPPMSNPPSPPPLVQEEEKELLVSCASEEQPTVLSAEEQPAILSQEEQPTVLSTTTTTTENIFTSIPMSGVATSTAHLLGPPFYEPASRIQRYGLSLSQQLPSLASTLPPPPPPPSRPLVDILGPVQASSTPAPSASTARPTSSRGGRKSKTHVASACINCKRAHLSCDVGRPCARCVASGKQDTCFDVQHKKRGRPRLRDESEFKGEQMLPESAPPGSMMMRGADVSSRPVAASRHRRTESYRSLRSQGSDSSGLDPSPTYPFPPPLIATQSAFGVQQPKPPPPNSPPGYEVPTAYLNLDLVIVKANQSYRQVMVGGHEVAGRLLADIVAPVDGESFHNIGNRLRMERDARDPAYMPPIHQPGQDPLGGALEADVDWYTQSFDERTYSWTQTQIGQAAQPFPARVRLAKANTYFVAVTLPSFRPVEQPGHHPAAAAAAAPPPPLFTRVSQPPERLSSGSIETQTPDSYGPPTPRMFAQSAPPVGGLPPFPSSHRTLPTPQLTAPSASQPHSSRTYPPPPQPLLPYQHHQSFSYGSSSNYQQPPPTAGAGRLSLPLANSRSDIAAMDRRPSLPAARDLLPPPPPPLPPSHSPAASAAGFRLAPIVVGSSSASAPRQSQPPPSATAAAGAGAGADPYSELRRPSVPATITTPPPGFQPAESSDSAEETPRKRRRLDIDDVLH